MRLVLAAQEAHPEAQTKLCNYTGWSEWFPLLIQRLFGSQNLVVLNVLQSQCSGFVPLCTEVSGKSFVNLVAQRDFQSLDRSVQSFAECGIPHV
jgi:hypothetical protein